MKFFGCKCNCLCRWQQPENKEITFKADKLQSITMKLPSGVKLHNVTTGKTSKAGEAVEISGGTKFYLSAPLTQVQDVAGSWSATMKGVTKTILL